MAQNGNEIMPMNFCIICLSADKQLTREHVFPSAIGGKIIKDILCKDCNDKAGIYIDGPFCKSPLIAAARTRNRISDRNGNYPQALNQIYESEVEGVPTRLKLNESFAPRIISDGPKITIDQDKVKVELIVDGADQARIEAMLRKALTRFFGTGEGRHLKWPSSRVQSEIERIVCEASVTPVSSTMMNTTIQGSLEINFRILLLQHLKILYSITSLETEGRFCRSQKGNQIRGILYRVLYEQSYPTMEELELHSSMRNGINVELLETVISLFGAKPGSFHVAIVSADVIAVSTFGTWGASIEVNTGITNDLKFYFTDLVSQTSRVIKFSELDLRTS